MGLENVKYDAFISYRHSPLDKATAIAIQKKLENFKLPKSLIGKTPSGKDKIERIFRDQDELPLASNLSDPIEEALKNSDNLIVICTPRLPESAWCAKEIETFISLHGREHVFAVLAEGEPEESFPDALRFERRIVIEGDGTEHEVIKEFEPLAADTRGATPRETKKMTDDAVLRLAAPIFGLNYDDLKQRHKEQRTKKLIATSSAIASVFFVFAVVCMFLLFQISTQKNTIEEQYTNIENQKNEIEKQNKEITKQNTEISKQNDEITEQNKQILAKNDEITKKNEEIYEQYRREQLKYAESMADASFTLLANGLRKEALYAVRHAMPDTKEGYDIPYSSAAEYALSNALGVYRKQYIYTAHDALSIGNNILSMNISPDELKFVILDSNSTLHIFDLINNNELAKFKFNSSNCDNNSIAFLDDDSFIISDNNNFYHYHISSNELNTIASNVRCSYVAIPEQNKYLAITNGKLKIYSAEDDSVIKTFNAKKEFGVVFDDYTVIINSNLDPSGKYLTCSIGDEYTSNPYIVVFDLEQDSIILASPTTESYTNVTSYLVDNTLYIVSYFANMFDTEYTTQLNAVDLSTNELIFNRQIPQCRLSNFFYSKDTKQLFIYSNNAYCTIDTTSKVKNFVVGYFPAYIISQFHSKYDDNVYLNSVDGSIYRYSFSTKNMYIYTHTYFDDISTSHIENSIFVQNQLFNVYTSEDYVAHFIYTENTAMEEITTLSENSKLSPDCTIAITQKELNDSKSEYTITDVKTGDVLSKVTDKSSSMFFIGDGSTYFGTSAAGNIMIYNTKGELVQTFTSYNDEFAFEKMSDNGKYLIYKKMTSAAPYEYKLYFAETGEEAFSFSIKITNEDSIYFSDASNCYALLTENALELYRYGESDTPFVSREMDASLITYIKFTNDGRSLFVYYANHTYEVLSTNTLETLNISYEKYNGIDKIKYIKSIDSYLFIASSDHYLLNNNFDIVARISDCISFDEATSSFIIKKNKYYRLPYMKYEDLINKADEKLQEFEPSEKIKNKYHM